MLKRGVQTVLKQFGYRLARAGEPVVPNCGLNNFFPLIKKFGFDPKHILDVGANHGSWTRDAVKYFPQAHYTLIEPQSELRICSQDLIDRGFQIHWISAGASDQPGMLPLYVGGHDNSSTFLRVPGTEDELASTINVPVRTLNEIVASSGLPVPAMVKIDAEGLDLKVLSGASDLFGKTEIFLAEVSIGEVNFANSALAVIQKMSEAGYRLIDITDMNRSPSNGVLWLCELVFLWTGSKLLNSAIRY